MAASQYDWSLVAANNATADADLTWAEGQAPSTVNNSARVMMQRNRQLLTDIGGSLSGGGTANVITLAASSPFAAFQDGLIVAFTATANNTTATTLNVNGVGAKSVRKMDGTSDIALVGGEITSGGIYTVQYRASLNSGSGGWLLVNPTLVKTGSYSPAFSATGCTFSYATQVGQYAKAGGIVTFAGILQLATFANTLTVNLLSILNAVPIAPGFDLRVEIAWTSSTASYVKMIGVISSGSTTMAIRGLTAAFTTVDVNLAANAALHASNGTRIAYNGSYFV